MISHWDDVASVRRERGHIAADWQSLTGERSSWVGVQRIRIEPGQVVDAAAPRGVRGGDLLRPLGHGRLRPVGRLRTRRPTRSARATASSTSRSSTRTRSGPEPTASRCSRSASGTTPRTRSCRAPASRGSGRRGCSRARPTTTRGSERRPPGRRRSASSPSDRRGSSTPPTSRARAAAGETVDREVRDLGACRGLAARRACGSSTSRPGSSINPPHCHSAEEEIFVVLDGDGTLELWPHLRLGGEHEEHPVTRGHASSRARPGPGVAHTFRAGDGRALAPRVRHARSARRHVLPSLGQGERPRARAHRPAGRARLLGWGGLRAG